MKRFKLYYTAIKRYNRSRGFGIHSPFAFHFITSVLGERSPFYAYETLDSLRHAAAEAARRMHIRHPRMISLKNARMLHRVACAYAPDALVQIGVHYGISTAAVMEYDSRMQCVVYSPANPYDMVFREVTSRYEGRLETCPSLSESKEKFLRLSPKHPMMMVNHITTDDLSSAETMAAECIAGGGVIVMRHLDRQNSLTPQLWTATLSHMSHGMSFSNGNIGFIVAYPHLPRQNFSLWF